MWDLETSLFYDNVNYLRFPPLSPNNLLTATPSPSHNLIQNAFTQDEDLAAWNIGSSCSSAEQIRHLSKVVNNSIHSHVKTKISLFTP